MGPDDELMPLIGLANVACGFHGGDPVVIQRTIRLAKQNGLPVGAHPSLPDREGFGRRHIDISPHDLFAQLAYQIGALAGMLSSEGMQLNHVKTQDTCGACVFGVPILIIANTRMENMATAMSIPYIPEFFPDIVYNENGKLMSILTSGGINLDDVQSKVERIITRNEVITKTTVGAIKMSFEGRAFSCCIHSDLPHPVETLQAVRRAIKAATK
ncbi:hypothetical protein NKR23_g8794 [Pleurostoma richardsiae]|uniref:LamB/YcsF family protein n=1 Tax=Pleurostoma richardsiae TaxID=41990 RepID=A0AA38VKV0_9PEZI|nr:hypothetical protein NKR23_g8794 [Pleurostoma richardsiae]